MINGACLQHAHDLQALQGRAEEGDALRAHPPLVQLRVRIQVEFHFRPFQLRLQIVVQPGHAVQLLVFEGMFAQVLGSEREQLVQSRGDRCG